ncbi:hypothetical protein C0Z18_31055 [Trinickia dabaoshanensis]|uniref:CzcB-like C-terminal circularly permuted SH3-like domain-containing protein n=1 Tax=Trinickia dabaoshanensis TaxID=564714 RepID=A0A2N7VBM3_9BURK|nr:efflux RND transporter periplasmic adaptor subunit [Trinickia dabaoshanensis]PMS14570.1 hypothetical protein C0Z18_31055 [Trinickia dabaoshanensis]
MDRLTRNPPRRRWGAVALVALPASIFLSAPGAYADGARTGTNEDIATTVVARAQTLPVQLAAYGQVAPTTIVDVRAVEAGTVSDLHVVPGSNVSANDVLARLNGPQMRSLLAAREASLRSAQARLSAATHALGIAGSQLALQLTTRQAIDAASSELAAARAAAQTAQAQLDEAREQQIIKAPAAGSVVSVQAADGSQALAGQTLLTIQPKGPLWVLAKYYGEQAPALRIGMTGHIELAGGGTPIPVKVVTIGPAAGADGGLQVGLAATARADWIAGQWGKVTLDSQPVTYAMIPTAALILDRGQWWVLVHTARGNEPRRVVPGQARGWETGIVSGLRAGERVVAQDAFLEYHRNIAQRYQPPD